MTSRAPDAQPEPVPGAPIPRRAPFSENPVVGARGLRTQQRILEGALRAFAEVGYEATTVERIAQDAECSRVAFYQYFSGKDEVFRHLAGEVARQLEASFEGMAPVTADAEGWSSLRAWVERHASIHASYEPLYRSFDAAAGTDEALAGGSARVAAHHSELLLSKLQGTIVRPALRQPLAHVVFTTLARTLDVASLLRSAAPDDYSRERVEDAVTDVIHRALFGIVSDVNARSHGYRPAPELEISDGLTEMFRRVAALDAEAAQPGRRALASLLAVGEDVIAERGYRGTRVEDLVAAAGLSRGAFYRYFENVHEFVRIVATRALRDMTGAVTRVSELTSAGGEVAPADLRRWLQGFAEVSSQHGAMMRVWTDAGRTDDLLQASGPGAFDWGRRQMAASLASRAYGDVDADAVVMLAMVEGFGSRPRSEAELDATAHLVLHGLLTPG